MKITENNNVVVAGEVCGNFEYSHEVFGEKFYLGHLRIERYSGDVDFVPVMVSDRIINPMVDWNGKFVEIKGDFRSYNKREENSNKLILSVFAQEFTLLDDAAYRDNHIMLEGYICKPPVYRKTPLGREITDFIIAVNRPYGKSDYIPCIAWGRNARYASALEVSNKVQVHGRIQSREYQKRISETETETRTVYEVSVSKLEAIEDEE